MQKASSAQILGFVDNLMDVPIFEEPLEYWDESVFVDLNEEFSDANQLN